MSITRGKEHISHKLGNINGLCFSLVNQILLQFTFSDQTGIRLIEEALSLVK